MKTSYLIIPIGWLLTVLAYQASGQVDSLVTMLTPAEYASIVKRYHPVVKQAKILTDDANAKLISARGGFDPQLKAYTDQKTFGGNEYYRYWNTELNIPTWYGINIQGGAQQMEGNKLNPERTFGQSNYLGISIPLGKNLLLDKRRVSLQQAKLFVELSEQEQNNLINNLLMEALTYYWTWAESYQQFVVMDKAVAINEQRFNFVRTGLLQGDRAAIDTTEAFAQLQNFYFLKSDAYLKFRNASFELSNFLWLENNTPYLMGENIIPDTNWNKATIHDYTLPLTDSIVKIGQSFHPKILSFDYKLRGLEVERKYKRQNLLPDLTLKSNLLGSGYNMFNSNDPLNFSANHTFGINFSLPLRLSEARGDLQQSQLKINATSLEQRLQKLAIENKVNQYSNELITLKEQVLLYESMLNNYAMLLRAEEGKFLAGESSLFIVNNRENRLLEINQKLLTLKGKFFKALIGVEWASGQLYQSR
jgi:outer membrane protein TolC